MPDLVVAAQRVVAAWERLDYCEGAVCDCELPEACSEERGALDDAMVALVKALAVGPRAAR